MQATVRQYEASRRILAIDPGPERSAWVLLEHVEHVETEQPSVFGIDDNEKVRVFLRMAGARGVAFSLVVIEQIASYGMAVGAEIFATVHWSGRFHEASAVPVALLPRLKVKTHLCHDSRAKDANIRAALIDRYGGPAAIRKGGSLYGVSKDVWSALALAVTYADGVR